MDILSQSALLVALTSAAIGITSLTRNIKNKLYLSFGGMCLLICLWSLSFFWEQVAGGGFFYRIHLFLNIWLAPAALSFVQVMVRSKDRFSDRLLWVSCASALVLSVALALGLDHWGIVAQLIYFVPSLVVIQILQLVRIDKELTGGKKRQHKKPTVGISPSRRILIYLGGLFVLVFTVMDHAPFLPSGVAVAGNVGLIAYLNFLSHAIYQQRMLNLSALVTRFWTLTLSAAGIAGTYTLLFGWTQENSAQFFLNALVMALFILFFLEPIQVIVRNLAQKLTGKEYDSLNHFLQRAMSRMSHSTRVDDLLENIYRTLDEAIRPKRVVTYLLDEEGVKYVAQRQDGTLTGEGGAAEDENTTPREILSDHVLIQHFEQRRRWKELPILLDQVLEHEQERSTSRRRIDELSAVVQAMKGLRSNLLIPFMEDGDGKVLGFSAVYAPLPPEPWGNNWGILSVIYPYFEKVAKALRSMEVFVNQREKERLAELGEMAAGLAHEIRNPLGAIKGAAQLLSGPEVAGVSAPGKYLQIITEEVDQLDQVVRQFLDYSRPGSVQMESADLSMAVRKAIQSVRSSLEVLRRENPGVPLAEIEFLPSSYPTTVHIDPVQIQQLVLNLVHNAIQAVHGKAGGKVVVTVNVASGTFGDGVKEAQILVEDNGPGISREILKKIFQPFFTTSPKGTGLGLSICQKIVREHDGRIRVASELGKYTRFTVSFPIIEDIKQLEAEPQLSRNEAIREEEHGAHTHL